MSGQLLCYDEALRLTLFQGLQETVACMCAVVQCLTRDFLRLVNLLKSCNGTIPEIPCFFSISPSAGLLQKFVAKSANPQLSPADNRSLSMLILIVSLLCEHCDFDDLSEQREGVCKLPTAM